MTHSQRQPRIDPRMRVDSSLPCADSLRARAVLHDPRRYEIPSASHHNDTLPHPYGTRSHSHKHTADITLKHPTVLAISSLMRCVAPRLTTFVWQHLQRTTEGTRSSHAQAAHCFALRLTEIVGMLHVVLCASAPNRRPKLNRRGCLFHPVSTYSTVSRLIYAAKISTYRLPCEASHVPK